MTEELVSLIDEFNSTREEGGAGFPCWAKLRNAGVELAALSDMIIRGASTLPPQTLRDARDLLRELLEVLKQCLQRKNEGCSAAGSFKAVSSQQKLRKLTKRLEKIKGDAAAALRQEEAGVMPRSRERYISEYEKENYEWTCSFIERDKIYGLEDQVAEIVNHLVGTSTFSAAGIVGMQGSGKTALAQKVFTDEAVLDAFALRLWVCVSPHECQHRAVLMRMLDCLGIDLDEVEALLKEQKANGLEEVGVLLFLVHMALADTSYLVVFDDVRGGGKEDEEDWFRQLSLPAPTDGREWTARLAYGLPKDDLGEKGAVIVTSRSEDVARAMVGSGGHIQRMRPLQDELLEEGWKVFTTAFYERGPELKMDEDWEKMKQLIVEKCNGLPLALQIAARGLADMEIEKNKAPIPPVPSADLAPAISSDPSTPAQSPDDTTAPLPEIKAPTPHVPSTDVDTVTSSDPSTPAESPKDTRSTASPEIMSPTPHVPSTDAAPVISSDPSTPAQSPDDTTAPQLPEIKAPTPPVPNTDAAPVISSDPSTPAQSPKDTSTSPLPEIMSPTSLVPSSGATPVITSDPSTPAQSPDDTTAPLPEINAPTPPVPSTDLPAAVISSDPSTPAQSPNDTITPLPDQIKAPLPPVPSTDASTPAISSDLFTPPQRPDDDTPTPFPSPAEKDPQPDTTPKTEGSRVVQPSNQIPDPTEAAPTLVSAASTGNAATTAEAFPAPPLPAAEAPDQP